ncbi:MAG: phosphoenolpyruvate synthase [Nanoarchaeota archaeon]
MAARGDVLPETQYIRWLSELNKSSGPIAGGKGANLAEMFNSKFPVPPAFVITTKAYYHLIESTGIKEKIYDLLESIDVDDTQDLEEKAKEIRQLIIHVDIPQDIKREISDAYEDLSVDKTMMSSAGKYAHHILKHTSEPIFVAVRSSATTEDLDDSSFAGQQESYLNIKGNNELMLSIKKVFASLFTARAIYYRKKRGFSKEKFALAVVVQKMIDSEKSGVIFTKNPINKNNNVVLEAVFGLGEGIVSGMIKPDHYEVSDDLKIVERKISEKKIALVRDSQGDTKEVKLTHVKSNSQVLEEHEIKSLANYALRIEHHYGKPQDIEFSIEGSDIYIVQSRPITTLSQDKDIQEIDDNEHKEVLLSGLGASPGVASGKVRIIKDLAHLNKIQKGDILVTEMTNPDMVVTMQKSAGIITDEGGVTSHAAIVSREMGIPAVVGTGNATKILKDGQIVTVDGFKGMVYEGESKARIVEIKPINQETNTKIKVILDIPEFAERAAKTQIKAVGLLRLEGIIASSGKHPMKFLKEDNLKEYTKIIQNGIEKIAMHFEEIWIRTSDIRSDEFSNLEGSPKTTESNPMLGLHGIRFSLKYPEILKSELEAIKKCAKSFPNKSFGVMIPQVISVEEVKATKVYAHEVGLIPLDNIKLGIMVETPAACLVIKNLLREGLDFISIGSNDLTQYTLAIDRNNESIQNLYNELNPAVLNAIKRVIRTCKELGVESSICGQAGSNKEMVKFLVENDIDSISVNADAASEISEYVAELEAKKSFNNLEENIEESEKENQIITTHQYPEKNSYDNYNSDSESNSEEQVQYAEMGSANEEGNEEQGNIENNHEPNQEKTEKHNFFTNIGKHIESRINEQLEKHARKSGTENNKQPKNQEKNQETLDEKIDPEELIEITDENKDTFLDIF